MFARSGAMRSEAMYGPCEWQRTHCSCSLKSLSSGAFRSEYRSLALSLVGVSQKLLAFGKVAEKLVGDTMLLDTGLSGLVAAFRSAAAKKQVPPFALLCRIISICRNLVLSVSVEVPSPQRHAATISTFWLTRL